MKIGGGTVIDNDGPHSPRELIGQKALGKGMHPVEIKYFDHNGGTLRLKVLDPNGNELPASAGIYAY